MTTLRKLPATRNTTVAGIPRLQPLRHPEPPAQGPPMTAPSWKIGRYMGNDEPAHQDAEHRHHHRFDHGRDRVDRVVDLFLVPRRRARQHVVPGVPDSSPTATIPTTSSGNTPASRIDAWSCRPVATSSRTRSTAASNTPLPAARATDSSASTRGTPAANVVDSVRVQRATEERSISRPNTGSRSDARSSHAPNDRERRRTARTPSTAARPPPTIATHRSRTNSDNAITPLRGRGQFGAEPGEDLLELRDHLDEQDTGYGPGHAQHRRRVDQRLAHLPPERLRLFLVRRDPVQHRRQRSGPLARLDQVPEEAVEVFRAASERGGDRVSRRHVRAQRAREAGQGRLVRAVGDDPERLEHGHAGAGQRRQLPRENGHVARAHAAAPHPRRPAAARSWPRMPRPANARRTRPADAAVISPPTA